MNGEQRFRVYNRCRFDIGVKLANGIGLNIRTGSFQIMSLNDILYVESVCVDKKFFATKMLEAIDIDSGAILSLENVGIFDNEVDESSKHYSDSEIEAALKGTVKKLEQWISKIDDPVELHSIYEVATKMDLPSSKLKVLKEKLPAKDWLNS